MGYNGHDLGSFRLRRLGLLENQVVNTAETSWNWLSIGMGMDPFRENWAVDSI